MKPVTTVRLKLVSLCCLAFSVAACGSEPAPVDVRGTWRTDARGYEGRTMKISPDSVWFSGADGDLDGFPIRDARSEDGDAVIEYGEGRATYLLRLTRLPDAGVSLRNQPHVTWRRADD